MKKIFPLLVINFFFLFVSAQPTPTTNVGIGTTTPTRAKLEVHGSVFSTSGIFGGETTGMSLQSNWPGIGFNEYAGNGFRYIANGYGAVQYLNPNNGYMTFAMLPNGIKDAAAATLNTAMIISNTGNIGLGGVLPNAQLQFTNTLVNRKIVLWESANNNNQFYGFGIEGGTLRYNVDAVGAAHRFYAGTGPSSSSLLMSIWGNRTVTIGDDNGGGKLGINLSSPAYTLSIKQAGGTGINLQESASLTNWHIVARYHFPSGTPYLELEHESSKVGRFQASGEYIWYSDSRLKTNVKQMPGLLEKLMQLRPVVYEMKKNNPGHNKTLGFIAQEVKPLFPELVFINENPTGTKDGLEDLHALNYSGFGVLAVKAIQEQQQIILQQQNQIDELKKRLDAVERKKCSYGSCL